MNAAQVPASALAMIKADGDVVEVITRRHPEYRERSAEWQELIDAYEGSGGYRTGSYLFPFPRESKPDFERRQASCRYHNFLGPIADLYCRLVFTQSVRRSSKSEAYNAFLEDVNGAGQRVDDFLKTLVASALATGHAGVLVDMTSDPPIDQTKAGERARVILRLMPATMIADWAFDGPVPSAVKVLEPGDTPPITQAAGQTPPLVGCTFWDREGWARFSGEGELIGAGITNLGEVPLIVLRPTPSYTSLMTGRPLVGSAGAIRALFNRCSEEDQVLRDQAFSVLTVSVGPDGNVEQAKEQIGTTLGTSSAIVTQGVVSYQTPDQAVPGTIRENIAYLTQEIYRAAHMRFGKSSGQVESGESIRLQHVELNEMLQGLARALSAVERQIARLFFLWTTPTRQAAEEAFLAAAPEANYPTEFIEDDLSADLDAFAEAIRMDLGPTMARRIKKSVVRRMDPMIPTDELAKIDAEIDAQPDEDGGSGVPLDRGDPEGAGIDAAGPL